MIEGYPYRFVMNEPSHDDYIICTSIYTFRSTKSNLVYLVRVEHYKMDIYIIKFYLKSNQNSPHKYNLLTNTFDPHRIINTCIRILLDIYQKDSKASFGFIGANRIGENEDNTKRYRVYKKNCDYLLYRYLLSPPLQRRQKHLYPHQQKEIKRKPHSYSRNRTILH